MRLFYVDYENVMDSGLNGIGKLTEADTVKIFYSEDAQRMSFGTHRRIIQSKATFVYQKISPDLKTLKNALDFLIVKDLEDTMKTDKSSSYFIVSKDNDFDGFINEKLKKKYRIKRIVEVCQASSAVEDENKTVQKNSTANGDQSKAVADNRKNAEQKKTEAENSRKKKEHAIRCHIGKELKKYNASKEYIVKAFLESSTRQELNCKLQKSFDNQDVKEIFDGLKTLIKDMPGR